jgi:hypothetical protein
MEMAADFSEDSFALLLISFVLIILSMQGSVKNSGSSLMVVQIWC